MRFAILLPALAGLAIVANTAAAQTGSVKGSFIYKGEPPTLEPLIINKDQQACGKAQPQKLLVDPATKGVANIFIWIARVNEKDIPSELKKPKEAEVVIDQKDCVFLPHCLIARAGQTLKMLNGDPVAHNVRATMLRNGAFNYTVAPNDREGVESELKRGEILPQPVVCDIHPWMQAHVLVVDHPYAAVSNEKGEFTIEGLPPGKYDFKLWHETSGYVKHDDVENVEVKAGAPTDLGKLEIPPTELPLK